MFGIRFRPAGITAFTRVPVGEFTDKHVELALVETLFGDDFYEILYDFYEMPPGFHEALSEQWLARGIFQRLDDFLVSRLDRLYQPDRQVARAVELICRARGGLSMSAVASDVCLCQRHFERKFRRAIGITPKMFARVARFTRAARCLQGRPRGDLLSVAVECGYYDHAHLIKEFKMLSGDVPGAPRG
ncbi:MAG: AraC family transcriptional regulator [Odoribacteraceae bacterium]|nr:AraC family transcriptional regulator [Odoribacteraceae bacterium]